MPKFTIVTLVATFLLYATAIASANTLADIKKSGVFKIAYRNDIPPCSSLDKNGDPHGFSIDFCNIIAASNFAVEYVRVTAVNRLEAVAKGGAHNSRSE